MIDSVAAQMAGSSEIGKVEEANRSAWNLRGSSNGLSAAIRAPERYSEQVVSDARIVGFP